MLISRDYCYLYGELNNDKGKSIESLGVDLMKIFAIAFIVNNLLILPDKA